MIQSLMKTAGPALALLGTGLVIYVGIQFAMKYAPRISIPFLNGGGGAVPIPLPQPSPQPGTDNPPAPVIPPSDDNFGDISDDYLFGDLLRV